MPWRVRHKVYQTGACVSSVVQSVSGLFKSLTNHRCHAAGRGGYRMQSDIHRIERVSYEGKCLQLPYKCPMIVKP